MRYFYTAILMLCAFSSFSQQKASYNLYFDFDKDVLTETSQKDFFNYIKQFQSASISNIIVQGHTDKKGTDNYNFQLSKQRADNVAQLLTKALPGVHITIDYFGKQVLVTDDEEEQHKNRRVQLLITYEQAATKEEETVLQPFFKDVAEQTFSINLDDTVIIKGKEGTIIKIPPGSIMKKDGNLMKGNALIKLKEYYNPSDILLAGLHSTSGEGLLQTGGMFRLYILQAERLESLWPSHIRYQFFGFLYASAICS